MYLYILEKKNKKNPIKPLLNRCLMFVPKFHFDSIERHVSNTCLRLIMIYMLQLKMILETLAFIYYTYIDPCV